MKNDSTRPLAIVTGAAGGIGRAICLALSRDGADVVAADMDIDGANQTSNLITNSDSMPVHVDISSEESVKKLYSTVIGRFGKVNIVINNAGIYRMLPILDISVEEWDNMMAVNLRGTFLMCREAFRLMKENHNGKIINIASVAGKNGGLRAGAHYSASKAGVICLTKSFALQLAPYKINVNAVCPGPVDTQMTKVWGEETNRSYAANIPWKEYAKPEDVAEAVAFLASERAHYITGEILDVNGGSYMD